MSDEIQDQAEGSLTVKVSARDVHKAVRNILQNEMKVDGHQIRVEALAAARKAVNEQVDEFLRGNGYDQAQLQEKVRSYAEHYLKRDIERMVADTISRKVGEFIKEQGLEVVAATVQKGITLDIGWRHKIQLKVNEVDKDSPKSEAV